MVLAGEAGYYWGTRQQTVSPPETKSVTTPSSPVIHSSIINWLEGVTPEMTYTSDLELTLAGELQSMTESAIVIKDENGVIKKFTFGKDYPPPNYKKYYIKSSQSFPASKEEIKVGDFVSLFINFNTLTGEVEMLNVSKLIREEVPTPTPTATPTPQ